MFTPLRVAALGLFLVAGPSGLVPVAADAAPAETKIVGGTESAAGAWPSQVALLTASQPDNVQAQFCGGSQIQERWILTAAHCVHGDTAAGIDILLGTQDLNSGGTRLHAQSIAEHPSYNPATFANDFALIELASAYAGQLMPIMGPAPDEEALVTPGTSAIVTGWGETENSPPGTPHFPADLREVTVPLVSDATCAGYYGARLIGGVMLCAGAAAGGIDSCQGDSGGPLVVAEPSSGVFIQVGVVSWGDGCAEANQYGIYSEIRTAYCWIFDTVVAAGYDYINSGLTNVGFETGSLCGWDTSGTPTGKAGKVITDSVGVNAGTFATAPLEGGFMGQLGSTYPSSAPAQPLGPNEMWQCFIVERAEERFAANFHTFDYTGYDRLVVELYDPDTGAILRRMEQQAWGPGGDISFKTTGWKPLELDLAGLLHSTVCLYFSDDGTIDNLFGTWMNIDSLESATILQVASDPNVQTGSGSVTTNELNGDVLVAMPMGSKTDITLTLHVECPDGSAPTAVTLALDGAQFPMAPAGAGFWTATIPAASVVEGLLTVQADCAGTLAVDDVGTIDLYDPSGLITDSGTGLPIAGATVKLYQVPGWLPDTDTLDRDCESNLTPGHVHGTWTQMPDAATLVLAVAADPFGVLISPGVNPQVTNAAGQYGWDVAQGCWFLHVSAYGYVPEWSPVVGVPPAVTDLDIALDPCACGSALLQMKDPNIGMFSAAFDDSDVDTAADLTCDVDVASKSVACDAPDPLFAGGASPVFPLVQLPKGDWTMTASYPGAPNVVKPLKIASTAAVPVDFKPGNGAVKVSSKGPSVDHAVIAASNAGGDVGSCGVTFSTQTLSCGGGLSSEVFPFINIAPGSYTFTSSADNVLDSVQKVSVKAGGIQALNLKFGVDGAALRVVSPKASVGEVTVDLTDAVGMVSLGSCSFTPGQPVGCDATALAAGVVPGVYPHIHFAGAVKLDVVATAAGHADIEKMGLSAPAGKVTTLTLPFVPEGGLLKVSLKDPPIAEFTLAFEDAAAVPLGTCDLVVQVSITCDATATASGIEPGVYPFLSFPTPGKVTVTLSGEGVKDVVKAGIPIAAGKVATFTPAPKPSDAFLKVSAKPPAGVALEQFTVDFADALGASLGSCLVQVDQAVSCDAAAATNGLSSGRYPFIQVSASELPATLTVSIDAGPDFKPFSKFMALKAGTLAPVAATMKFA